MLVPPGDPTNKWGLSPFMIIVGVMEERGLFPPNETSSGGRAVRLGFLPPSILFLPAEEKSVISLLRKIPKPVYGQQASRRNITRHYHAVSKNLFDSRGHHSNIAVGVNNREVSRVLAFFLLRNTKVDSWGSLGKSRKRSIRCLRKSKHWRRGNPIETFVAFTKCDRCLIYSLSSKPSRGTSVQSASAIHSFLSANATLREWGKLAGNKTSMH